MTSTNNEVSYMPPNGRGKGHFEEKPSFAGIEGRAIHKGRPTETGEGFGKLRVDMYFYSLIYSSA